MTLGPRYLVRRLVALAATLVAASVVIYGALSLAPGDPATMLAGGSPPNPQVLAEIHKEYHLDDPFWSQYWHWISNAATGDFGQSIVFRGSVSQLLAPRITNTLLLISYCGLVIIVVGIGLGMLAALRGRRTDTGITMATTVLMGTPTFVVAVILSWGFAAKLGWFPVFGGGTGFLDRVWHLTLPALALSGSYLAFLSRTTRSAIVAEKFSEHVDTARSRGLPSRHIVRRHVMRNASGPILNVSGAVVAGLLASTAVIERAFGVNGLGSLLVDSALRKDMAVVMAISLLVVALFVVIMTIVDAVNAAIDPRITAGVGVDA
ncbi:ABC transporter permease [Streptomyces sp. NBC_00063]|uniref:ABC transporter permease n=1 Tax=Streptomyces sp. NBC_00063 TaxID=2975638 RepID=UPI003D73291E